MNRFTVKIIELVQTTPSAVTLLIEKPDNFNFKPGQWAYFTLWGPMGEASRALSFSSSPTEPHLQVTKRMSGSGFCRNIELALPGDEVAFSDPMGSLVYEGGLDKVTFLAGGIGITPIRSILKNAMDKKVTGEKNLIYGNLNIEEAAFSHEIRTWEDKDPGLKVTHVLLDPHEGWNGFSGFIDRTVIEATITDLHGQIYYVSGPPSMVEAVTAHLRDLGIRGKKVLVEQLKGYEGMV